MSSILIYTSPARGHLFPVLGVALEMKRRGHGVHLRTLAPEIDRVRSLGIDAEPIDPAVESREMDDWRGKNPVQALEFGMQALADRAEHEVDDLRNAIEETSADCLLIDTNSWGAQAVAEASGLPWASFQPFFTPLPAPGVPPFGPGFKPATNPIERLRDKVVGAIAGRKMAKTVLPGVNASRLRLGLEPFESMTEFLLSPPRVIYFTVEGLEHPRPSWPSNFRFVGPGMWSPDYQALDWLDSIDRSIALVTCSTERQDDQIVLESALASLPSDGLFVVGTSAAILPEDVDGYGAANTRVERFLPHEAVLGHAEVAVCHGGMGITQRALSHGVPLVVVPFGRDQLEVASRVESAGAGVAVSPKKLSPAKLAEAVRQARKLAPGARRLAKEFAEAGGDSAAADVMDEILAEGYPDRVTAPEGTA